MEAIFKKLAVKDRVMSRGRQMTESDVRILIACSGADHPLHTDPIFCKEKMKFHAPILQGAMVMGVVDAFFNESIFNGDEVILAYGYDKIRFIKPTHLDDVIQAEFELVEKEKKGDQNDLLTFQVTVRNQENETLFFAIEKFCVLNEAC